MGANGNVKRDRNRAVRQRRSRPMSQRDLARTFGVSRWRIRQILDTHGGDPLLDRFIAQASENELARRRARLVERIATDLRTFVAVEEELEVRRNDRLLGLTG